MNEAPQRADPSSAPPLAERERSGWERAAYAALALSSLLMVMTCSAMRRLEPRHPEPAASASVPPAASVAAAPARSWPGALGPVPQAPSRGPLASFHEALAKLERGEIAHAHVAWLGDSHTAADFLTHQVRARLQERFGNGGSGFVRVGVVPYRHTEVATRRDGQWRREPGSPSTSERTGDGVFGLGGIRAVPGSSDARAALTLRPGAVAGQAVWELAFRLPTRASGFELSIDGGDKEHVEGQAISGTQIQHVIRRGRADGSLELTHFSGGPELFGVVVESSEPGLVLDTLGIDGARAATPLAWDGATWVEELAVREPALVVLAFGTNEVFAEQDATRYADHYRALVARVRSAVAGVSCLLVGPTDVPAPDGLTRPRVIEIDEMERQAARELGCAYFSLLAAMGGPGSFERWRTALPALAAEDRVHLTQDGYETLGDLIARWLVDGYAAPDHR